MKLVLKPACLFSALLLCLFCPSARIGAQETADVGSITGVVIDNWYRRGLGGVIVTVRGTTLAATTDVNGQYQLEGIAAGEHIVVFSKSGYARSIVTNVRVVPGQRTKVDNYLRPEFYEMEEYVVDAPQLEQEMADLLGARQNDVVSKDVLGKDFLSKAGVGDAGEAAAKIVGVTIEDGKFLVVRGLSERYSNTLLNGAQVPSADPDKKAVQMDIIPADAIERIETSKTFTPDQPGNFSGGSVNVVTRKFPEEHFINVTVGMGYNSQATFNDDFLTYDGGGTDWAGFDDGARDIPSEWSDHDQDRTLSLVEATRRGPAANRQIAADEVIRLTKQWDNQMTPHQDAPPPDLNFSASTGDKLSLFDKPLGYYVGVNYERKFGFDDGGFLGRYNADPSNNTLQTKEAKQEITSVEKVSWGSLVNLAYEFLEGHELSFNFLYNRNMEDEVIVRSGFDDDRPDDTFGESILHYTERELQSFQLHGRHEFPQLLDMRTEWSAALSSTMQSEPDYRVFQYARAANGVVSVPTDALLEPTRFYREVEEDNRNLKFDQILPFSQWTGDEGEFKIGLFHSGTERNYADRRFAYLSNTSPAFRHLFETGDPDAFLANSNIVYEPRTFGAWRFNTYLSEKPFTEYDGTHDINAAYGMIDLPLYNRLKFVGGARFEVSELFIESTGEFEGKSEINEDNFLPSASLIYEVMTNMNVRLAYGKTVARPTFREIGPPYFDFVNNEILIGNPDLEQTDIDNYDLRWEWFRRPGEVLAASLFYKNLKNPIEKTIKTNNGQVEYQNRDEAELYGFELEARTQLDWIDDNLDYFNIGANFAWIESTVDTSQREYIRATQGETERELQGQSPYVVNADITFSHPRLGTTASLFYNLFGERLSEVSEVSPNVFEQPVHSLDFILSQKIGDHATLKFAAKNLLNPEYKKTIEFGGDEFIYSSHRRGRTFSLSLSYDF